MEQIDPIANSRRFRRPWLLIAAIVALLSSQQASAAEFMFRARVGDQMLEGQPLAWSATEMFLLGRDGRLHEFDPRDATEGQKTSPRFVGYSMPEIKRELYREFGDSLDVTTTQHYIVVHPRSKGNAWAGRFEELYRWCLHYFRVRGYRPREPQFPLVAVVYRNQADYYRAAKAGGMRLQPGMLGHYELKSNRVHLFDVTAGQSGGDWSENAATIIHEATHQTAFNTGIHSRFTAPPLWVAEGLATMFEAPGVYNSRAFPRQADRINQEQLRQFQELAVPGHGPERLAELIASDRPFRTRPSAAYATAWALTFYLVETQPGRYADYLALTAGRPPLETYTADERTADFAAVFGEDWQMLEARFLRFMEGVK